MKIALHEIRNIVFISLLGYLGTLAVTQTAYGERFMNLRWVALSVLLVASGWYWLNIRQKRQSGISLDKSSAVLLVYLLSTFLTVVFAENPLFSGFRWASHAMMLIVFSIFLRQIMTFIQIEKILLLLKVIIGGLLLLSLLKPAPQTIYNSLQVSSGAFGNANNLGQVAAIGVLIYLHSYLIGKNKRVRYLEAVLACVSMGMVWWSGSRSATIMLVTGIGLITFFYRQKVKGKFWGIIFLIILLVFVFPALPHKVKRFISKSGDPSTRFVTQITKSREEVWSSAWEGFKSRPLSGWGFGADSSITKNWAIKLTSLGTVERDAVNDMLFMLEGCGVIGFGAYLLLVYISWKQKLTSRQISILRQKNYGRLNLKEKYLFLNHTHAIMFTLAMSLLVLFQFDNTALSAGNFISVMLWLSVGAAGALRKEVLSSEIAMHHYLITEAQRIQKEPSISSSPQW